jgi:hypothetical protein
MWHLAHTGHQKLSDGSVLRLDAELGRYVASFYNSDLTLRAYGFGSFAAMQDLVAVWADAFEASLASPVGGESGAALGDLSPAQPPINLNKGIA